MIDAQWQSGNLVIVGPEAASTGVLQYPKPNFK
jgi:hypothetical protein